MEELKRRDVQQWKRLGFVRRHRALMRGLEDEKPVVSVREEKTPLQTCWSHSCSSDWWPEMLGSKIPSVLTAPRVSAAGTVRVDI